MSSILIMTWVLMLPSALNITSQKSDTQIYLSWVHPVFMLNLTQFTSCSTKCSSRWWLHSYRWSWRRWIIYRPISIWIQSWLWGRNSLDNADWWWPLQVDWQRERISVDFLGPLSGFWTDSWLSKRNLPPLHSIGRMGCTKKRTGLPTGNNGRCQYAHWL